MLRKGGERVFWGGIAEENRELEENWRGGNWNWTGTEWRVNGNQMGVRWESNRD